MFNYIILTILWVATVLDHYITGNTSDNYVRLATMAMVIGGIIIERTRK